MMFNFSVPQRVTDALNLESLILQIVGLTAMTEQQVKEKILKLMPEYSGTSNDLATTILSLGRDGAGRSQLLAVETLDDLVALQSYLFNLRLAQQLKDVTCLTPFKVKGNIEPSFEQWPNQLNAECSSVTIKSGCWMQRSFNPNHPNRHTEQLTAPTRPRLY